MVELSVFGSLLRDDFGPDSDVDFLVVFRDNDYGPWMGKLQRMEKDLGAVHSCAHALSTVADLHHGLANGIMIDHVMRFNLPAATAKMAELARIAGVEGAATLPKNVAANAFVDREETVRKRLNAYHDTYDELLAHYRKKGLLIDVSGGAHTYAYRQVVTIFVSSGRKPKRRH